MDSGFSSNWRKNINDIQSLHWLDILSHSTKCLPFNKSKVCFFVRKRWRRAWSRVGKFSSELSVSYLLLLVQEEVLSDTYKRIIFYNITARPVRQEYTLTHVFKGQFNMLNFIKRWSDSKHQGLLLSDKEFWLLNDDNCTKKQQRKAIYSLVNITT